MLTNLIVRVAVFSFLLFIVLVALYGGEIESNMSIYLLNLAQLVTFFIVVIYSVKHENYSESHLVILTLVYNFVFVLLYAYQIHSYTGHLFQFIPSDAPLYDDLGRWAAESGLFSGVIKIINNTRYKFDDMGFIFYVSIVYRLIDSPLMIKFLNVIMNSISALLLFRVAQLFVPKNYAFIAAIMFCISSYTIWFLVSGLKEPLMVLIIIAAYYQYYKYTICYANRNLIGVILLLCTLLFFRIPILIFMVGSMVVAEILKRGHFLRRTIFISISFVLIAVLFYSYAEYIQIYLNKINPTYYDPYDVRTANINPLLSISAGVFGPFPTVLPTKGYEDVSVYSGSLILKVFLSTYAVFGLYYALKEKLFGILPLILFCIMEIAALSFLSQTFKLRTSYPHFPFVIITAIYVIFTLQNNQNKFNVVKNLAVINNIALIFVIFLWNCLRI